MTQEARYYYDCPIKAVFMSKYHGLVLELAYTKEEIIEYDLPDQDRTYYFRDAMVGEGSADMWSDVIEAKCRKIYVAEESLPLLQPQVGDLIHIVRGFCSYYKEVVAVARSNKKDVTGIWCEGVHWDTTSKEPLHDWEILKRNGTPFIMPERGE